MKRIRVVVLIAVVIAGGFTQCFAADCTCGDWVNKGGYCVDYIKDRIPSFPAPQSRTEIATLKNKDIPEVTEGDVAMFNISNYWHVAYVEKVRRNDNGVAVAIDVSEMNYGDQMSFDEFKAKWKSKNPDEWKRAVCCGVTDKYDQTGFRKKVALNTVKQIWSPDSAAAEGGSTETYKALVDKVRDVFHHLLEFSMREL